MATFDVVVAGAGPAGAAAACLLARRGCSVALVDPRVDGEALPGAPAKPGEALPGAAERILLAADLPAPTDGGAHRRNGGNASAWGRADLVHRDFFADPDGPGWRLDRSAFEHDLVTGAARAGARLRPRTIRGATRASGTWRVTLHGGDALDARWIIDATGRAAKVAREAGARRIRDEEIVAVVGRGRPSATFAFGRTLVETAPLGWWYAARLPDESPVFMLHTRPEDAVRLTAHPSDWEAALVATRHVSTLFPHPIIDGSLRGFEACGAWLEPVWGEGWAACGDAALSFEPAAAQGLFGALAGAVEIADAVETALRGDTMKLASYATRLAGVRSIYRRRMRAHYAEESRWPEAPFWRERHPPPPSFTQGRRA